MCAVPDRDVLLAADYAGNILPAEKPIAAPPFARMRLAAMLLGAAWSLAAVVASQAQPVTSKIVGLGAATCVQFTNDVSANPTIQRDYLAWAQGFMSAILLTRPPGTDEGLDLNPSTFPLLKQLEFLRDRCMREPSTDFADAVKDLYKKLRVESGT
jgi:hypothetical protein